MSFIQCWVGILVKYISQIRGNTQIQTMSHLVMVNRLQKNTKLGKDKNIKALQNYHYG
jgi:hypothetical protein